MYRNVYQNKQQGIANTRDESASYSYLDINYVYSVYILSLFM